jgi:hypothetical protein
MGRFLSSLGRMVRTGWKAAEKNTTAFNEAMRFNLATAVAGEYPEQFIDFSKVQLSSGQLPVLTGLVATAATALSMNLSWENNSGLELANGSDLLMVGVYDSETGEGYTISGGFSRQQEAAAITLPDNWSGRTVEVFVFLISTMGIGSLNTPAHISPTIYAGTIALMN